MVNIFRNPEENDDTCFNKVLEFFDKIIHLSRVSIAEDFNEAVHYARDNGEVIVDVVKDYPHDVVMLQFEENEFVNEVELIDWFPSAKEVILCADCAELPLKEDAHLCLNCGNAYLCKECFTKKDGLCPLCY